ncbi:MAG: nitrous oxide reductase family maturation protein NosD [Promethearchaeota archaeon]
MKNYSRKKNNYINIKLAIFSAFVLLGFTTAILSINLIHFMPNIAIIGNDSIEFNVKNSAVWNSPITISGTSGWSSAQSSGFVSAGDGSLDDPYIIENHVIDLQGVDGIGLTIENSDEYFIIRNCVFKNIGSSASAGIDMQNVKNGKIINNACSYHIGTGIYVGTRCQFIMVSGNIVNYNNRGIWVINATDNIITGNTAVLGNNIGIMVDDSDNNIISSNTISNCQYGIYLSTFSENHCDNNVIVDNTITNCTLVEGNSHGIYIGISYSNINYNLVYRNVIQQNEWGISLFAPYNDIIGNTISSNYEDGIITGYGTDHNKIIGNVIEYNNKSGIFIRGTESYPCENNLIGQNVINYNSKYGILIDWGTNNMITGNSLTGNTNGIHENSNCINQNYIYENVYPAPGLSLVQILIIGGIIVGVIVVIVTVGIIIKKRH